MVQRGRVLAVEPTRGPARRSSPGDRTRFIGRAKEIGWIERLAVGGTRLITVLGPAGAGKTRVAREFAARTPRPAWFCDLSDARTAADVSTAVAAALDLAPQWDHGIERVGAALAARGSVLVVLDNFEQAVEASAETVGAWLDAAPSALFVVTSREPLRLYGEAQVELGPLPLPDALTLFEDRARLARASFALAPDDLPATQSLLQALDCNPLAIELAAARVRTHSPAELLRALRDRFALLQSDRRDVARRHLSLASALDWSWDLLASWERDALAQCSVFRGGFTHEAAAAVLDLSHHAGAPRGDEAVASLRSRSLVAAGDAGPGAHSRRFALYESVREYAAARLESSGERPACEARHVAYFAQWGSRRAEELHGSEGMRALAALTQEKDNLLAAFRVATAREKFAREAVSLAVGLEPVLAHRGPFETHREVIERALACAATIPGSAAACDARYIWARMWLLRGVTQAVPETLAGGAAIARALGDDARLAACLGLLGYALRANGQSDEARSALEEARSTAVRCGHVRHEGSAELYLGLVAHVVGDNAAALGHFARAESLLRACGSRRGLALTLANRANTLRAQRSLDAALEAFEQARALFDELGDRVHASKTHVGAAAVLRDKGDCGASRLRCVKALTEARAAADGDNEAQALLELAALDRDAGDPISAAARVYEARRVCETRGAWPATVQSVECMERTLASGGAIAPAERRLVIARDGWWFEWEGRRVDLTRRVALRRVLLGLAALREQSPGAGIPFQAVQGIGWPGERLRAESAMARIYSAVRTLRVLGLGDVLLTRDGGYLLDPQVTLRWVDEPPA